MTANPISREEFDALAESYVSRNSGKTGIKVLPSYLTNADGLELSARMEALADCAAKVGVGFHFWELFLNSGLYNAGADRALHSSHDRLTVSFRLERDERGLISTIPHIPTGQEGRLSQSNQKPLRQVKHDIDELINTNRRYRSQIYGKKHYDRLYEHFRFLCINTFIHFVINPNNYGFSANGLNYFFDKMLEIHPDVEKYTVGILGKERPIPQPMRASLEQMYLEVFESNLDLLSDPVRSAPLGSFGAHTNEHKCILFLRSIYKHSDDFAAAVLSSYREMPLSCLRIFFNFSNNVYLPWSVSATSGGRPAVHTSTAAKPYPSSPAKMLRQHEAALFQPVNYPSYQAYNKEAKFRPFSKAGVGSKKGRRRDETKADDVVREDHLGPMLVWPINLSLDAGGQVDRGMFWVSGFLRLMGRYDPKSGEKIEWDNYENQLFDSDVRVLSDAVTGFIETISAMLATKRKPRNSR